MNADKGGRAPASGINNVPFEAPAEPRPPGSTTTNAVSTYVRGSPSWRARLRFVQHLPLPTTHLLFWKRHLL